VSSGHQVRKREKYTSITTPRFSTSINGTLSVLKLSRHFSGFSQYFYSNLT
jgi:hypothetical protein